MTLNVILSSQSLSALTNILDVPIAVIATGHCSILWAILKAACLSKANTSHIATSLKYVPSQKIMCLLKAFYHIIQLHIQTWVTLSVSKHLSPSFCYECNWEKQQRAIYFADWLTSWFTLDLPREKQLDPGISSEFGHLLVIRKKNHCSSKHVSTWRDLEFWEISTQKLSLCWKPFFLSSWKISRVISD